MAVRKRLGRFVPVEESVELQMFHHARRRLEAAGLSAYEISNYATPGDECRHNLVYWTGGNYIGLRPLCCFACSGPSLEKPLASGRMGANDWRRIGARRRIRNTLADPHGG